jgi:hypothetical protein
MNVPAAIAGVGVVTLLSAPGRRAVGVPIVPFITPAHRAAMATLVSPILGVPLVIETGRVKAQDRYNEVIRGLHGSRGFVVLSVQAPWGKTGKSYPKLTAGDGAKLLDRFLAAASAGVKAGYRVTNVGLMGVDVNGPVAEKLASGEEVSVALTALGSAFGSATKQRNTLLYLPGGTSLGDDALVALDRVARRLVSEMDYAGYLESGKPPPDPTVIGGIAAAGDAVGRFATGLAGSAVGGIAGAVVGSSLFWFAGLAFVAFKVLR